MTSNQLLKHIDFDIVKKNPKIFCGYSDISVLHYAFHKKSRLITFYGPAAMTQFGDYPRLLHHTVEYFLKAVCNNKPISTISPSKEWTDEFLDWSKKLDIKRARRMRPNKGFEWLSEGKAKGPIIGGCLSSIIHLRGTDFWPSHKGCIMFLETPEGQDPSKGEPLSNIDSYLTDLELSGVFDEIKGLIFGRAFGYSEEDTNKLKSILINVGDEYSFPILYGADIGHTDPMITIPLGIKAVIDSENDLFTMQENGVK
jgi:muramoyltetrapeptide carboxypeptidase